MLDIFRGRLFETTTLTAAINEIPFVPGRLGQLGIFSELGVPTTTVIIEKNGTVIKLIPTSPRGSPGTPVQGTKRSGVPFVIPRLAAQAQLHADEVQNVREFGTDDQLAGVEQQRDAKLNIVSMSLDMTLENHRLGAIQGVILDADGETVLFDLYDRFEIAERAAVSLELDAAWAQADGGRIRGLLMGVARDVRDDLGGISPTGLHTLCGDDLYDQLINHPELRETYLQQQEARDLREGDPFEMFKYGPMVFENYRGSGTVKIADNEARVIPLGVPELFITRFGPADYMEAVNTVGLPKYTKAVMDPSGYNRFIEMEGQSNPLNVCTRPRVLRKLTLT